MSMKKKMLIIVAILFAGCLEGGTHGYIRAYRYNIPKNELEKVVRQVISESSVIHQDSIKEYYNDDSGYVTISIMQKSLPFIYTFRYYGDNEYWDTSKTSEIFIAYAHDADSKGGSSGNGGVKWYDFKLKKRLTEPFERELVNKIDSVLGIGHTEE